VRILASVHPETPNLDWGVALFIDMQGA